MLISDLNIIGTRLYRFRKQAGLTQEETAEKADISCRAYADIERGSAAARLDTLIHICNAIGITPNDLLTDPDGVSAPLTQDAIAERLTACTQKQRDTALLLLNVYLDSLK
ncbi:MAG: helix-turn-helix transcriptional regulator [Clostridia bacterium]|nr:helix-turn-helix transcriptional regulator [Clostridia bacterium]